MVTALQATGVSVVKSPADMGTALRDLIRKWSPVSGIEVCRKRSPGNSSLPVQNTRAAVVNTC